MQLLETCLADVGSIPLSFLCDAGCDGGFRSPFVLYVSAWITGLVFGTLLLFFEDALARAVEGAYDIFQGSNFSSMC